MKYGIRHIVVRSYPSMAGGARKRAAMMAALKVKTLFAGPGLRRRPSKQLVAIAVLDQMVQRAAAAADQRSGCCAPPTAGGRADAGADGRRSGDRQNGFQLGIATASGGRARRAIDHFLSGGAGYRSRYALFSPRLKTIGVSVLEPVVIAGAGGIGDAGRLATRPGVVTIRVTGFEVAQVERLPLARRRSSLCGSRWRGFGRW